MADEESSSSSSSTTTTNAAESSLSSLLVTEIQCDGGASYISHLRQYDNDCHYCDEEEGKRRNGDRIGSLLQACSSSSSTPIKLLTFLENNADKFQLLMKEQQQPNNGKHAHKKKKNAQLGHIVSLKPEVLFSAKIAGEFYHMQKQRRKVMSDILEQRLVYLLTSRKEKMARRLLKRKQQQHSKEEENQQQYCSYNQVTVEWLIKHATWDIHRYVRMILHQCEDGSYYPILLQPGKNCSNSCNNTYVGANNIASNASQQSSATISQPLVGTQEWQQKVYPYFLQYLKRRPSMFQVVSCDNLNCSKDVKARGEVGKETNQTYMVKLLEQVPTNSSLEKQGQQQSTQNNINSSPIEQTVASTLNVNATATTTTTTTTGNHSDETEQIVKRIHTILSQNKDHTIGGMDIGMLLSDSILRKLLHGRDIHRLLFNHQSQQQYQFNMEAGNGKRVEIYCDEKRSIGGQWRVRLVDVNNGCAKNTDDEEGENTILMDEIGKYSITSKKAATAMANALYQSSRKVFSHDKCDYSDSSNNPNDMKRTVCIDMTAGVGGNTIAFCKIKAFDRVIALENNPQRATMLLQNVLSQTTRRRNEQSGDYSFLECDADDNVVTVKCMDSLEALPKLQAQYRPHRKKKCCYHINSISNRLEDDETGVTRKEENEAMIFSREKTHQHLCIIAFLDPPWGGIYYRQKQQRQNDKHEINDDIEMGLGLTMGDGANDDDDEERHGIQDSFMPLSKVITLIALHLAPLILGVKVPLSFDIRAFVDKLEKLGEFLRHDNDGCGDMKKKKTGEAKNGYTDGEDCYCRDEPSQLLSVKLISVKKLHPQLFFILHLDSEN